MTDANATRPADSLSIEKKGRRHYVRGNTYPMRHDLRSAGFRWDPNESAWWTGKASLAGSFTGRAIAGASYTKTEDGSWAVMVYGDRPAAGSKLEVMKASGSTKTETVESVVESGTGFLCRVVQRKRSPRAGRPQTRCKECRGALVDAPHHVAMEGYCGACAFDEFDC